MTPKRMSLVEFGLGILAGLRHRGVLTLSSEDEQALHTGFEAAFRVVINSYGEHNLRFYIILDELHGTTPQVHEIMNWWLSGGWATKDAPGTTWRLGRTDRRAAAQLFTTLPGGATLWVRATDAFMATFHGWAR